MRRGNGRGSKEGDRQQAVVNSGENPMRKNAFIFLVTTFLLLAASADGQQPAKIPKIGYLAAGSLSASGRGLEGFRLEFRKLGYVEGKNIAFESRNAENKLDRLPALADELVRLKVDVIVTPGANDTHAAKNATKTIPIVFLSVVSDPVTLGLVDSLARPGGNVTGFTTIGAALAGKRLELLKETIPKLSRVAVLWHLQNPGSEQQWKESQLPAKELGLQLHSMAVNSADKFESEFKDAVKAGSGALAVTGGGLISSNRKQIVTLAAKNQLPAIASGGIFVEIGGLMSYGPDGIEPYQRAAVMVDKILKGANPADLPVEQPSKFELVINLKTARALGLTIPPIVLMRAQRVIR
jgi:putative ABC transport system substrate-binding protein